MAKKIAYGFSNTNRKSLEPEQTHAYKQLEVFFADEIVVDVYWYSERRKKLEAIIEELDEDDTIFMYSVDTLLKGKNKGAEYYAQIIKKGIGLFVLDLDGDMLKVSPISTYFFSTQQKTWINKNSKSNYDLHEKLIDTFNEIEKNYKPTTDTGKTTYKSTFSVEFRKLYFMYESYRITEKDLINLLPEKLKIYNKQTFISLSREYEKSIQYISDFEEYCYADEKFLELPKRTGKLPREYDEIIALSKESTKETKTDCILEAFSKLRIWSTPDILSRWTLSKEKVPKPRKPDDRYVKKVYFD